MKQGLHGGRLCAPQLYDLALLGAASGRAGHGTPGTGGTRSTGGAHGTGGAGTGPDGGGAGLCLGWVVSGALAVSPSLVPLGRAVLPPVASGL